MSRRNLLEETLEVLKAHGLSHEHVEYVCTADQCGDWEHFAAVAKAINYDAGYGSEEINSGLVVVGDGWWLERGEYDGSEWREYKVPPTPPHLATPLTKKGIKV